MWDALQGYHQIGVEEESQDKLAFAGPDATKWTYNVMLLGPVNGPAMFIAFIHDVDNAWKDLACLHRVVINKDTNTNIIVDDFVSWAKTYAYTMMYKECQLKICQLQNLSLRLKKLHIFPKQFKFVRIDICQAKKCPTMSKNQLLQHWPTPIIIHDVAKLVGFMQFYSCFILHFLRFESRHCVISFMRTTCLGSDPCGPEKHKPHLTQCIRQFWMILASKDTIIASSLSFAQTFPPKGLAIVHANWRTTTYHFKPCINVCRVEVLTS
jgi:hypothetical protein